MQPTTLLTRLAPRQGGPGPAAIAAGAFAFAGVPVLLLCPHAPRPTRAPHAAVRRKVSLGFPRAISTGAIELVCFGRQALCAPVNARATLLWAVLRTLRCRTGLCFLRPAPARV